MSKPTNLLLSFLLLLGSVNLSFATSPQAMNSVCSLRIVGSELDEQGNQKQFTGSGVVYKEDKTDLWIMTAGHVVFKAEQITAEFFVDGFRSKQFLAKLHRMDYAGKKGDVELPKGELLRTLRDLAILKVEKRQFKDYPIPRPVILGNIEDDQLTGTTVFSIGCPSGQWPSAVFGHITDVHLIDGAFEFVPNPLSGRSGSPVFDPEGKRIIGIITHQGTGKSHCGIAVSVFGIRRLHTVLEPGD